MLSDNGEGEVLGGIECGCEGCAFGVFSVKRCKRVCLVKHLVMMMRLSLRMLILLLLLQKQDPSCL